MRFVRHISTLAIVAALLALCAPVFAASQAPAAIDLLRSGTNAYTAYYKTLDALGWSTVLAPARLAQPGGVEHAERVLSAARGALARYADSEQNAFVAAETARRAGALQGDDLLTLLPGVRAFVQRDVALEHQKLDAVSRFLAVLDRQAGHWHLAGTDLVFDAGRASPDARAAYAALGAVQSSISASRSNWQVLQQVASGHRLALLQLAPEVM